MKGMILVLLVMVIGLAGCHCHSHQSEVISETVVEQVEVVE